MYSSNSKDAEPSKREEGNTSYGKITKAPSTSSSANPSSPWLRLKDPRIVRVSRAFGGKDRHSKVCTIRGLRDRRVRLSVPTAIQLYDLQDRLGLNQPSKVVDWLLNAAKQEIDELPPLPISPGRLGLNHQQFLHSHEVGASGPSIWSSAAADAILRAKSKEAAKESVTNEKENWITKESDQGKQVDINEGHGGEISSFNFLPKSSSNNNNNNPLPSYGSYYHLGPSNFPLPQLGSHGFISVPQTDQDHLHSFNVVPLPSTFSSQILVCPPNGTTQPLFPSHTEIDPRHINQFQMLNTNSSHNLFPNPTHLQSFSQSMRPPFHFMNSKLFPSHSISGTSQSDREQEFTFK